MADQPHTKFPPTTQESTARNEIDEKTVQNQWSKAVVAQKAEIDKNQGATIPNSERADEVPAEDDDEVEVLGVQKPPPSGLFVEGTSLPAAVPLQPQQSVSLQLLAGAAVQTQQQSLLYPTLNPATPNHLAAALTNPSFAAALGSSGAGSHNLIPPHLQTSAWGESSLIGTPGHSPALIPAYSAVATPLSPTAMALSSLLPTTNPTAVTPAIPLSAVPQMLAPTATAVQQNPLASLSGLSASTTTISPALMPPPLAPVTPPPPVYNGVNPQYPGLRVLNNDPPVFCVDNFLTPKECKFLIDNASDSFGPAPVVGRGAGEVSPSRTSSTCYLAREDLPDLLRKVATLTGKPFAHCELPQVGRYFTAQQYLQHFDAFNLDTEDGIRFASNGGQRTITCLLYLNTVEKGGGTHFPTLNLTVQPVQGTALVFFPATIDGTLDPRALHAALPAVDTKYVSQIWIRQGEYHGLPSKRLPVPLGVPLGQDSRDSLFMPAGAVTETSPLTHLAETANAHAKLA